MLAQASRAAPAAAPSSITTHPDDVGSLAPQSSHAADPRSNAHAPAWAHYTDPRVNLVASELDFGRVEVGEIEERVAYIQNTDDHPLSLDGLSARVDDPFHELTVSQIRTLWLQPGELASYRIRYEPKRAATISRSFSVLVDGASAGPGVELIVRAEAFDRDRDARIQQQRTEATASEAEPNDLLRPRRVRARHAIEEWAAKSRALDAQFADWCRDSWQDYLGSTGGSYQVAPSDRMIAALEWTMKNALKAATKVEDPVTKLLVKTGTEWLVKHFTDWFREIPPDADEVAADATRSTAAAGIAKNHELSSARDAADAAVDDTASGAELAIARASLGSEIDEWQAWAQTQLAALPKPRFSGDRSLTDALLAEWVLQTAATPSAPNATTNPTSWARAKKYLEVSGQLPTIERTDLFVHQCLGEWSKLGLVGGEEAAHELDTKRVAAELDARSAGVTEADVAKHVASLLDKQTQFFFRVRDPVAFAQVFQAQYTGTQSDALEDPSKLRGRVSIACTLHVKADRRGVIVDEFEYAMNAESPGFRRPDGSMK